MQQTIPVNDRTISSSVGSTPSSGPFTVDFPFFSLDDVVVLALPAGAPLESAVRLVRGADYSLIGVATEDGSFSSGTVTLVLPVSNTTIIRSGNTDIERLSNFPLQGFFSRLALNAELNRITVVLQEIEQELTTLSVEIGTIPVVARGGFDFYPGEFGGVGDGVADDTLALQLAIDACAAAGGGIVDCTGGCWLIDSADLLLKRGVVLKGPWLLPGIGDGDLFIDVTGFQSTLIINSAYKIKVDGNAAGIEGLAIFSKAVWTNPTPTTLRQNLNRAALFAGTAVDLSGTDIETKAKQNFFIQHCCIGGFEYGITLSGARRARIDYLFMDNNNCIYMNEGHELAFTGNVHCWPFLTPNSGAAALGQWTVSGAVNNGSGLIRLTTSTAHVLVTGDTNIVVGSVGGVTAANGTWTVSIPDSTHIDLVGSTFAGVYTSGGTVSALVFKRKGVAIFCDTVTEWAQLINCFAYGYQVAGFKINDSPYCMLLNCGTDNYGPLLDTVPIGIHISGTSRAASLVGCKTPAQGVGLKIDITSTTEVNATVSNHRSWGDVTYAYQVVAGSVSFVNCEAQQLQVIRVEADAKVSFIGGDLTDATLSYATGAPQVQFLGTAGAPVTGVSNQLVSRGATGSREVLRKILANDTRANNDTIIDTAYAYDSANSLINIGRMSYRVTDITAGAATSEIFWGIRRAGTITEAVRLSTVGFGPLVHNSFSLGFTSAKWSNLQLASLTVATLPAAGTSGAGARAHVSDSNTAVFNAIVASGGANSVPVFCDGTNWRVG